MLQEGGTRELLKGWDGEEVMVGPGRGIHISVKRERSKERTSAKGERTSAKGKLAQGNSNIGIIQRTAIPRKVWR